MPERPLAVWFHCFSGIAGDMALGSLLDLGADLDEVRSLIDRLPVGGWRLTAEATKRCGIAGTKARVHADETGDVVRTAAHIFGLLEEARLPERVRSRALATFEALAVAEGRIHDHPPAKVHFHEVGGLDAIVDIVGTCAALEVLGVDQIHCSPIAQGRGTIKAAHGVLPNPAPAVVELLCGAPTYGVDLPFEMTTPTGAALMAALASGWGPMPAMVIEASGFGAGDRDIDGQPNLAQAVLGRLDLRSEGGQPVVLLETNVDDATGEILSGAIQALLAAGAHDAWLTPIVMKKGRPAYTVSALADTALADQIADTLASETGTLGVRGQTMQRWPASRVEGTVDVEGRTVRVKVSSGRIKVEHDDAAIAAQHLNKPVREVISLAEAAWRSANPTSESTESRRPSRAGSADDSNPDDDPASA